MDSKQHTHDGYRKFPSTGSIAIFAAIIIYMMIAKQPPAPPFTSVMVIDSSSLASDLRQSYIDGAITEEQLREQLTSLNQRIMRHIDSGALVLEKSAVVGGSNVTEIQ